MDAKKVEGLNELLRRAIKQPPEEKPAPAVEHAAAPPCSEKEMQSTHLRAARIVHDYLQFGVWAMSVGIFVIRNVDVISPEQRKSCEKLMDKLMSMMKVYEPVASSAAKYCAKLQLGELQVEKTLDAIEAFRFRAEMRKELEALR